MPLQKRISLVAAATVAVAVAFAVLISYFAVRDQLVGQISNELRNQAAVIESNFEHGRPIPGLGAGAGGSAPYARFVPETGSVPPGQFPLPDTGKARAVAVGTEGPFMSDVVVGGARLQMYTFQVVFHCGGLRRPNTGRGFSLHGLWLRPTTSCAPCAGCWRSSSCLSSGWAALLARMATAACWRHSRRSPRRRS